MYALQSAAVTHTLYAACRRGAIEGCTCRQPGPDTRAVDFWKWSGCGEGLSHSGKQARRFLNARETEGDARSLMNRHNNRAGVKVGHVTWCDSVTGDGVRVGHVVRLSDRGRGQGGSRGPAQ